jgi:hypothetical protein
MNNSFLKQDWRTSSAGPYEANYPVRLARKMVDADADLL